MPTPRSSPTSEDQAASRANRRNKARNSTGGPSIVTLRMAELYRVFCHRYGGAPLPDDDAGRDDLKLCFQTLSTASKGTVRMTGLAMTWAPWMPAGELSALIKGTLANPRRFKADTVAERLGITMQERTLLDLRTIGAVDCLFEQRQEQRREKLRLAKEKKRRAAGKLTRAQLRIRCETQIRPWSVLGICATSWYRRRKKAKAKIAARPARAAMHQATGAIYS